MRAEARGGLTAAAAYLRKKGKHLDPLVQRYIEACMTAPFSFHDVIACEPGRGFTLRDIITGLPRHRRRAAQPGASRTAEH